MYTYLQKLFSNTLLRRVIIVILSLMALVSVVQGIRNAAEISQDFQWDAAKALMEGIDPYEASLNPEYQYNSDSLDEFYRLFADAGVKQKMEANQFPSLLMLLIPFTWMNALTARYAWIIANLFFTAGIIFLLRKTFLKKAETFEFLVLILLMLSGTPYRNQLGVGQHTLFSFFFFMLAVYLDEKKPSGNRIAVAFCMFVSYFKYTLTAPLTLYLLYRKRYREFAASIAAHLVLTVIAAVRLNTGILYMITAPLKVSSLLSDQGGLDLGALLGGGVFYLAIGGIIAISLLIITVKMPKGREYLLLPLLLLWSLILTYHRSYDYFVLVAVAFLFLENENKGGEVEFIRGFYYFLSLLVYFLLRVFNENMASKIGVGIIYYAFTAYVTYLAVREIGKNRELS